MSSIFRKDDNVTPHPKRNTFDLSFQNNLTVNFGKLTPVMVQEVIPGDSFKIEPSFGLRYLPQVFPVQTRQRASLKFYYVRNRNLWKDWPDFIGKTKQGLTPPYIKFGEGNQYYLAPSSLADYMGVPIHVTTSVADINKTFYLNKPEIKGSDYTYVPNSGIMYNNAKDPFSIVTRKNISKILYFNSNAEINYVLSDVYGGSPNSLVPGPSIANSSLNSGFVPYADERVDVALLRMPINIEFPISLSVSLPNGKAYLIFRDDQGRDIAVRMSSFTYQQLSNEVTLQVPNGSSWATEKVRLVSFVGIIYAKTTQDIVINQFDVRAKYINNTNLCWCDVSLEDLPYANSLDDSKIRISALPFRAVEAIYNALVRNAENNPLIIDGQPEYNKYNVSVDGGRQYPWQILGEYNANWSDDRFTTALPSPQQGNAPLVGLTGVQGATLTTSTEDGTTSTLHLQVDSTTGNVVFVDGVSSDSPEYLSDAIMSAVEYGITINDLRNVNAFQKWLENNIRRGYKYKDQLMAHYGVKARYDVLDMPEFIGGVTRDINVSQITQTVENEYGNLGEYGGLSSLMAEGHSIEHYCDEHGFIIGLLSVTPVPLYQDYLPKHLIKSDAFDFFFPEFGKIGMQPISNKELAFSQSILEGTENKTFGYQRAWYDYLENLDQVHGLYRSDFRNYLLARDFYSVPQLGADFLTVDHEDLNNTFYVDDNKDKILGQIYFKIIAKRPIPLVGIPSIE